MRRVLGIILVVAAVGGLLVVGSASGGDEGNYEVRAIFDNGAFLVNGEEVRVAGAKVGTVADVTVTNDTEAAHADGSPDPGKAVVVLRIDDAGFQDFRKDASCLIRPQGLLGEKFVECEPTQPRAPGTEPPPALEQIEDGQPGAGEYFLPLESNGKAVDLDLVNNIMREPYADRFRLILNDLGASFAARGDELDEIIDRSDPALRETNAVLAILAKQSNQLAELARNGDAVLEPLARDRDRIGGFINSAGATAEATAERSADLERGLALFPQTLRELRTTMGELNKFSEAGIPTFTQLAAAAPAATKATEALGPFANSSEIALESLGKAAAASQSPLVHSDPLIKQIRKVSESAAPATSKLGRFLRSLDRHGGFKSLLQFVYQAVGATNAFDNLGHFARAFLLITNCNDYETTTLLIDCVANFKPPIESTKAKQEKDHGKHKARHRDEAPQPEPTPDNGQQQGPVQTEPAPSTGGEPTPPDAAPQEPTPPLDTEPAPAEPSEPAPDQSDPGVQVAPSSSGRAQMRDARRLLDFLVGRSAHRRAHGGKR